jgi:hypothetical protein
MRDGLLPGGDHDWLRCFAGTLTTSIADTERMHATNRKYCSDFGVLLENLASFAVTRNAMTGLKHARAQRESFCGAPTASPIPAHAVPLRMQPLVHAHVIVSVSILNSDFRSRCNIIHHNVVDLSDISSLVTALSIESSYHTVCFVVSCCAVTLHSDSAPRSLTYLTGRLDLFERGAFSARATMSPAWWVAVHALLSPIPTPRDVWPR